MSPQRTLARRSLELLTRQLMERRRSASEMSQAFLSDAYDVQMAAGNSDRLDLARLTGTAAGESLALAARAEEAVREIDDALDRITDGTYGYCEGCNQTIPYQRLKAIPATTVCVGCKNLAGPHEAKRVRGTEGVLDGALTRSRTEARGAP